MIGEILGEARTRMGGALDALKKDLVAIRTGRASVAMLDDVRAEAYGAQMPLNQLATLSTPDPRLIVVQPWDKGTFAAIEKALMAANLGMTPQNDGKVIRLPVPPLTEERRKGLVKQARKRCEEAKVEIRSFRREAKELLEELEQEGEAAKDDVRHAQDELQKSTDDFVGKIDQTAAAKEKEIMEF